MEDLWIMTKLISSFFLILLNLTMFKIKEVYKKNLQLSNVFYCPNCKKGCIYKLNYFNLLLPYKKIIITCVNCKHALILNSSDTNSLHKERFGIFAYTFFALFASVLYVIDQKHTIYELLIKHIDGYITAISFVLMQILFFSFLYLIIMCKYYSVCYNIMNYISEKIDLEDYETN